MAINKEKIAAAKLAVKTATTEHKTNVKALQAAEKAAAKSDAKVQKATAQLAKLVPVATSEV